MFKIKRQKLYLQQKYYFTEAYTYFPVGMTTHKEREGGASHTLLTVRFLPYQQLRCYQISHYSAALLMPFDRR